MPCALLGSAGVRSAVHVPCRTWFGPAVAAHVPRMVVGGDCAGAATTDRISARTVSAAFVLPKAGVECW